MTAAKSIILGLALVAGLGSAQARPWTHYTDPKLGWSIFYPEGWKVDPHHVSASLGPDHEIHGVSFTIDKYEQAGTNLSHNDTAISVESVPGKDCKPSQFVDPAEHLRKVKDAKRTYLAADSEDAGAGNFYQTRIFVVPGTSPCIAVRYFIHSTNIGNYDPGTVKAFNAKKLMQLFDGIRGTLTLKP